MVSRLREAFNLEIPVRILFKTPTIAGLALRIEGFIRGPPRGPSTNSAGSPGAASATSLNQEHLWSLDQMIPGTHFFNMPYV